MGKLGNFFIHRSNDDNKVTIEIGVATKQPALVNAFSQSLADISDLTLNYSAATIEVHATDRDELSVREYMLIDEPSYYANVTQTDDHLVIAAGDRPSKDDLNIRIEVEIPQSYRGHLEISSVSGTIKLNDLKDLKSLAITSTSGDIDLAAIRSDELTIDSITGAINGRDLIASQFTINAMSGNVRLLNTRATYRIHCSAGSLHLDDAHGHGKFEITSGSAKLSFSEVNGNLSAESSAGSIRLQVPHELNYGFNLETSIGKLKTPDYAYYANNERNSQTGSVGEPTSLSINMLTVVGSLTLEAR